MPDSEKVVSDSSPLIWLSKVNRVHLLRHLFGKVIVPERVRFEVVRGKSADAVLIREAFRDGWIIVEASTDGVDELMEVSGIHGGEAEAILLARELGALFLVDDREASVVARVFGVRCLGTVGVLLSGLSSGLVDYGEFVECVDEMIGLGFRLSVDVYRGVLREARRIAEDESTTHS